MNSQIFPNNVNLKSIPSRSFSLVPWQSSAVLWLSIIMLIAVVILFPERPAWGGDRMIEADPAGINGAAHGAKLADVVKVMADEIRIDQIRICYRHPKGSAAVPQTVPLTDTPSVNDNHNERRLLALPISYGGE